jgi:hypothetical protein
MKKIARFHVLRGCGSIDYHGKIKETPKPAAVPPMIPPEFDRIENGKFVKRTHINQ